MRRTITMIVAAGALLMLVTAGVAVARQAQIICDDQSPAVDGGACKGTRGDDAEPDKNGDGWPDGGIYGTAFDDHITALAGADRVDGEFGDDTLEGGGGADYIEGDYGDDTLYGGKGRDTLRVARGKDAVYGGPDADTIEVYDGDADDTVSCGGGKDIVYYDDRATGINRPGSDKIAKDCEVLRRGQIPGS
jgi:Ca2+-binding RTX toxin-like protein